MPKFGKRSLERLETCCVELQNILHEVIKVYDISVLEGFRDEERQNQLFDEGKSKLRFPDGKHNKNPSSIMYPTLSETRYAYCLLDIENNTNVGTILLGNSGT